MSVAGGVAGPGLEFGDLCAQSFQFGFCVTPIRGVPQFAEVFAVPSGDAGDFDRAAPGA